MASLRKRSRVGESARFTVDTQKKLNAVSHMLTKITVEVALIAELARPI